MRDLIPAGTGNSRFLKSAIAEDATWEDAKAALRAGSFPVDFGGVNADGVEQLGTPYSKAAVLPDDVAAALGMDPTTNPEPKDAFMQMLTMGNKVRVEFLTSGTWTAPANIVDNKIHVWCCGGGGGGGAGLNLCGGGGGGGGYVTEGDFTITPGSNYSIVIGAGGSKGKSLGLNGADGGATSFSSLLTASGGYHGNGGTYISSTEEYNGGNGGSGGSGGGGGSASGGHGGTNGSGGTASGGGNGGTAKSSNYKDGNQGYDGYSGTDHASGGGLSYGPGGGGGGGYGGRGGYSNGTGGGGGGGFWGNGGGALVYADRGGGGAGGNDTVGTDGASGVVRIEYYIKGASA